MDKVKVLGRVLFALPLLVFAVQHFLYAAFVATLIPAWYPKRLFWAYFTGAAFVAAAVAIVSQQKARLAAGLLGIMFLIFVVTTHAPRIAKSSNNANEWTSGFVALAMCGGAWIVAASFPRKRAGTPDRFFVTGRILFGVAMAAFGVQHLIFARTAGGIGPPWFPGGMLLAGAMGALLFLLGVAPFGDGWANVAGVGLGTLLLLHFLAVHAPRLIGHWHDPGIWTSAAEMLSLCGAAFAMAGNSAGALARE